MNKIFFNLAAALVEPLEPDGSCAPPPLEVSRAEFTEMLYQIYKAKPLAAADFRALCVAAVKLGSKHLQWHLCQQIIHDNEVGRTILIERVFTFLFQLNFVQKVQKAASLDLDDAVRQLCYDAIKSGEFAKLTADGVLNARQQFGPDIYSRLVVPTIIEVRELI